MKRIGIETELDEETRSKLLGELRYWRKRSPEFYELREREEAAFMNIWKDQHPNGLRLDKGDELAFPFNGSSDQRVRWGENAFKDFLALAMTAISACRVEITTNGAEDAQKRAAAIIKLIEFCKARLGAKWHEQIMAMMRYMLCDTPAVAALDVGWTVRETMGVTRLDFDECQDAYSAWRTNAEPDISSADAAAEFALACEEGNTEALESFFTGVMKCRREDVEAIIDALETEGECEALHTAEKWEGPEVRALRFGDDFMVPMATDDFDTAEIMFRHRWLNETELRALAAEEEWDPAWVEDTLKYKGSDFYEESRDAYNDDFKDLVDLVWFYTTETDGAGRLTRRVCVMSLADGSAFGWRVLSARRGKWEMVFFRREVVANNCLASRGLAHLCAPDQGLAKRLKDGVNNNAILGAIPPIKAKGARVRNVAYEPFGTINMGVNDDVAFMQPPAFPATAKQQIDEIKSDMLAYLGLSDGKTDVSTRQRGWTEWLLVQFQDFLKRLVECAQDYASDELLASLAGEDGKGLRREDLDGYWSLTLKFDPANINHEDLIKRVNALAQVIAPLDARNEIDRGPAVRHVFAQLFPDVANVSFRSAEALAADDVEDEKKNFLQIKAGIMPAMDTEGKWNYGARLGFYNELQQQNPEALQEMGPASQEMLQKWLKALEQQERQHGENAQIGRTGLEI